MFSCTSSTPCNLPVRCGFGTVSSWCVSCLSMAWFFLECLWSAACKQNNGTSRSCASRFARSTMLRAMFSQYMPMTWPCLNKSVVSSFLHFRFCECAAEPSDSRTREQQACTCAWLLWFLAGEHPETASTSSNESLYQWSSMPPGQHGVLSALCAAFCGSALRDCQLRRSRWQAWSAKNHLQSAKLVCVPWALLDGNSWLDQGLHLDGRACCGKASCFPLQLAPNWFHLEGPKF